MAATQKVELIQTFGPDGIVVPMWYETGIKVYTENYVWVISDFHFHKAKLPKGEFLKSPIFTDAATNSRCKWYLELYPNGSTNSTTSNGALFLFLDRTSSCSIVFGKFIVNVLDESQKKVQISGESLEINKFEPGSLGRGWRDFMKDHDNILPLNNKLTVHCEISFSFVKPFTNTFDQSHLIKVKSTVPEFRLSKDLEQLFRNEEMSDVVLSVNGKEYKAHKTILAARSPVFAAMFKHENMEENQQNTVKITDFDEQIVEEVLNYIYTDKSENLKKRAFGLLAASEKYGLDGLKKMSERVLSEDLSIENVIDMLILADRYSASELKVNAINFIVANSAKVMKTPDWKITAPLHPQLIVEICEALSRK